MRIRKSAAGTRWLLSLGLILLLIVGLCSCGRKGSVAELPESTQVHASQTESPQTNAPQTNASQTEGSQNRESEVETSETNAENLELRVHFLDVGQGAATLIESRGHYMLVDGGPSSASSFVVSYLIKQGVKRLDYIVATHYDEDHLSGVIGALNRFEVGCVLNGDYETDTQTYTSYVEHRDAEGCRVVIPGVGDRGQLGDAEFTVVGPLGYEHEYANNNSIGIRLTCGDTSFLLVGDMEFEEEYEILDAGVDVRADVLLAGHHGSANSTSERFLEAVTPSVVVISCGNENSYGHPSENLMVRLQDKEIPVCRTDHEGTILAASDGKMITFSCTPGADYAPGVLPTFETTSSDDSVSGDRNTAEVTEQYIGNVNSQVFHQSACRSLPKESNRIYFDTREEAEAAGYHACGICRP